MVVGPQCAVDVVADDAMPTDGVHNLCPWPVFPKVSRLLPDLLWCWRWSPVGESQKEPAITKSDGVPGEEEERRSLNRSSGLVLARVVY